MNTFGEKGEAIYSGALRNAIDTDPYNKLPGNIHQAALRLAYLAASLTSTDKAERERAKHTVRELVKLGKGE